MSAKHLFLSFLFAFLAQGISAQNWNQDLNSIIGQQERLDKLVQAANSPDLSLNFYEFTFIKVNELLHINPTCLNLHFNDPKIRCVEDLIERLESWKSVSTFLWLARVKDLTSEAIEDRIQKELSCNYYNQPLSNKQNEFLRNWFRENDKQGFGILTYEKLKCN